jgi:hypothetical protein
LGTMHFEIIQVPRMWIMDFPNISRKDRNETAPDDSDSSTESRILDNTQRLSSRENLESDRFQHIFETRDTLKEGSRRLQESRQEPRNPIL